MAEEINCACIEITYQYESDFDPTDPLETITIQSFSVGQMNSYPFYEFSIGGRIYQIYWENGVWYLVKNPNIIVGTLNNGSDCPIGIFEIIESDFIVSFSTTNCPTTISECDLNVLVETGDIGGTILTIFKFNRIINGKPAYLCPIQWISTGGTSQNWWIYWNGSNWVMEQSPDDVGDGIIVSSAQSIFNDTYPRFIQMGGDFYFVDTFGITCVCPCIEIDVILQTINEPDQITTYEVQSDGEFFGVPTYKIKDFGFPANDCSRAETGFFGDVYLGFYPTATPTAFDTGSWIFSVSPLTFPIDENDILIDFEPFKAIEAGLIPNLSCPKDFRWTCEIDKETTLKINVRSVACKIKCSKEERTFREYNSIKLPKPFVEQKRGGISCCCKYLVLAGNGTETWKNDKTSAWIKVSDPSDTFTFVLKKHGVPTNYIPTPKPFINEPNAFFTTIEWSEVLNLDGVGCYNLSIDYEISGVNGSIAVGDFDLKFYSIETALKTARVRAIFDGIHETDGINFSGSGVESTFRFYGFIGNRQPNTEIDNIIYQNREMKRVIRENLNTYELITDPENECVIKPLLDLYLLSENQLFISDYNEHNHSYRYLDIPVTLNESASVEYKEFSRLAVLKCTFEDKFKTNRTYYG
jgi:hypothetical protein